MKTKNRTRYLIAGLAAAFLLATGAGAVYAAGQMGSTMGSDNAGSDSMMGDGMDSMMNDGNGMGSMMGGSGGMGSFEEDEPFDLQFIDQMIVHHRGAVMSSEMMIADSERPELRRLAEDIQRSQSEQIEQMKDMREQWYPEAGSASGMMGGDGMDSMMGDGMMEGVMGGDGMGSMMGVGATDEMFLRMMIPHHQMAVDMSEEALEEADHLELKELAGAIKDEQSAEIELMRSYLEEIEGAPGK